MSYDLVKSVRDLIMQGVGDTPRLEYILDRLESGKYLFLSDQKYLENLLLSNQNKQPVITDPKIEVNYLKKFENNLRSLNEQLENTIKSKQKDQIKITSEHMRSLDDQNLREKYQNGSKNENLTLVLSVVLGFISLQGIGHMYIGKIARGLGILTLSLLLSSVGLSYFMGIITKDDIPSSINPFFIPLILTGYLGLYVFQILDGHKLCVTYNRYLSQHEQIPPWW